MPIDPRSLLPVLVVSLASAASCSGVPSEEATPEEATQIVARIRGTGAIAASVLASEATPLRVEVPERASAVMRIEDARSGVRVDVVPAGARDVNGEPADGAVVYRDVYGAGAHLLRLAGPGGVEDLLVLPARPREERLAFRVDVSQVPGLRLVSGALELLDADGTPRLRVAPPWVVDASGARNTARLVVLGCAYDTDLRAPWGRPVVSPGATSCELAVDWSAAGVAYPAVVDPLWTATGALTWARYEHSATVLGTGKVLVAGGSSPPFNYRYCELYDPASRTFALTGSLAEGRRGHSSTRLASGKVLVAGGNDFEPLASAELYDPAAGTWSATGAMSVARGDQVAVALSSGRVLAVGGGTADVYDPGTGTWTPTAGAPLAARSVPTATLLRTGKVLLAGGAPGAAELFDPQTGTFVATGTMTTADRDGASAALLPDGRVLVAGGIHMATTTTTLATAELYDPPTGQWSDAPPMATPRRFFSMTMLLSGKLLAAGTYGALDGASAELFDPATGKWSSTTPMSRPRVLFTLTTLPNGTVLAAGGSSPPNGVTGLAEILELKPDGAACALGDDCASGFCTDGVCCDRACGACEACTAAKKGGGQDGVCAPYAAGTDPDSDCPTQPFSTCGTTGVCDGKGACENFAAGVVCVAPICSEAAVTVSICNGHGQCQPATGNCAPYGCKDSECRASCDGDEHCAPGSRCDVDSHRCIGGATCDGAHTLLDPAGATIDCAPYACEGSACKVRCTSVKDCADGFVCGAEGACERLGGESASGCAVAAAPADARLDWLLGSVLVAVLRRALRSRRSRPRARRDAYRGSAGPDGSAAQS